MNWTQVIEEIHARGITHTEIAALCGTSQGNLSDLKAGRVKNPAWPVGDALLDLHKRMLRRKIAA